MTEVLGAIDAGISLAERLYVIINGFKDAPESAKKHLLSSQLSNVRLDLLRIATQQSIQRYTNEQKSRVIDEFNLLNEDLKNAIDYLENNAPNNLAKRMQWAVWTSGVVTVLFQSIEDRFNVLQRIFDLARLAPNLQTLDKEHFTIVSEYKDYKYLTGAPVGYYVEADLVAPDNSNRSQNRPRLDVFVESYRPLHEPENDSSKEKYAAAREIAKHAAERLWWSRVSDKAVEIPYQTGVLPCIGYDDFRVVFLLPKNANLENPLTLRECIRTTRTSNIGVSLESRFSIALQLAEAVLRIHLTGLAHRSIRSNKILLLTSKQEDQTVTGNGNGVNGAAVVSDIVEDDAPKKPTRVGTFNQLARRFTFKSSKEPEKAPPPKKAPHRVPSKRSMRNSKEGGEKPEKRWRSHFRIRRGGSVKDESLEEVNDDNDLQLENDNPSPNSSAHLGNAAMTPRVGNVQPGFGSVYLTCWAAARYSGLIHSHQTPDRSKDIFMHPSLHNKKIQYHMGHDIYSLGVCLLEIGMWGLFVHVEGTGAVYGRLATLADVQDSRVDVTTVKKRIEDLARKELPAAMGDGYAEVVRRCLTWLNHDRLRKDAGQEEYCERFQEEVVSLLRNINEGFHLYSRI